VYFGTHPGLLKSQSGQVQQTIIAFDSFLKKAERPRAKLK
jgi:hypothetical protein